MSTATLTLPVTDTKDGAPQKVVHSQQLRSCYQHLLRGDHPELPSVKLTQPTIGKMVGMSASVISQWLGDKYTGDVTGLERKLADALAGLIIETRLPRQTDDKIFPTYITTRTLGALATTKKVGYVGIICGPSGLGKSMGAQAYCQGDALAVYIDLNAADNPGTKTGIIEAFWESPNFTAYGYSRSDLSKSKFLCRYFRGQGRLIIIDEAHTLTKGGLEWLAGFHKATGCPLAIMGTPKVLEIVARAETFPTHVAFKSAADFEDTTKGKNAFAAFAVDASQAFAESRWPDHVKIVQPIAQGIIESARNLRTLRNISSLAHLYLQTKKVDNVTNAWGMAKTRQFKFAPKGLPQTYKLDMLPAGDSK